MLYHCLEVEVLLHIAAGIIRVELVVDNPDE
jgi:hypothetical protein